MSAALRLAMLVSLAAEPSASSAEPHSPQKLSKDAYNAISELARFGTSLRLDFGRPRTGRSDGYGLRLRPVIVTPIPLPRAWKIVPRVRMPVWIAVQDATTRVRAGLSDIDSVVWLATPEWHAMQLGLGPAVTWPTAGNAAVGDGEWGVGPAAAFVLTPGPFVAHVLAVTTFIPQSGDSETELEVSARWNSKSGWALGVTSESEIPAASPIDSDVYVGPTIAKVVTMRHVHLQLELAVLGWVARDGDNPSAAVQLTTSFLLPSRE